MPVFRTMMRSGRRPRKLYLPLSLHILTSRRGVWGQTSLRGNLARQVAVLHHEIERSLAVFVLDGVLERFPQLKIASAENDVAWVPTSCGEWISPGTDSEPHIPEAFIATTASPGPGVLR
jgi:hypothetical protein